MKKRHGFTLAEVLITLGIIGVVASMTIPILMQRYQDEYLKNQFKKVCSTLYNATTLVKSNNGLYPPCRYDSSAGIGPGSDRTACTTFWDEMKKNLHVVKVCDNYSYSQGCIPYYNDGASASSGCSHFAQTNLFNNDPSFVLNDGTIILPYDYTMPLFMVDINGAKPPNKWGTDVFTFMWIDNLGEPKLVPGTCFVVEPGGRNTTQMMQYAFK